MSASCRLNALEVEKHCRRRVGSLLRDERSARGLDGFDLFNDQLEPVELTIDLRSDVNCKNTSIASSEIFEPFAPVATYRLISSNTLPKLRC